MLRALNKARVDGIISRSISHVIPDRNKWHYLANLSYILEEEPLEKRIKEHILSSLIAYYHLPNLTNEERVGLLEKIYIFNSNIFEADEDEILSVAEKFSKKAERAAYPLKISSFILNFPLGMQVKDGKFSVDEDYPTSLLGLSPLFVHLINRHTENVGYLYEFRFLLESSLENIAKTYTEQEDSIVRFLSEEHLSALFPFLFLLNRQGKYIFLTSAGIRSYNFIFSPVCIKNFANSSIIFSLRDVFTTTQHRKWFIEEIVKDNDLQEALITLKDIASPIVYENFFVEISTELSLIYLNNGKYHKLTNYGIERYWDL
ncbi:MAG: hypothetical protein QXY05_03695 [Candidatus Anstonellales archaeon]